jgi:hypothetical protein
MAAEAEAVLRRSKKPLSAGAATFMVRFLYGFCKVFSLGI